MKITPAIERTEDGSVTLRHPHTGETYHSSRGAVGESMHVFIRHGLEAAARRFAGRLEAGSPLRIFEVGFGSGLNAWLTLDHARTHGLAVEYTAIELYPVDGSVAEMLGYTSDPLFTTLHTAPWNLSVPVTDLFSLRKIEGDFASFTPGTPADLVYFDAFAPDAQPELWSRERFAALAEAMSPGGILVTYSAKGLVKQNLRDAGLEVRRLPGALGKRHMLRAEKPGATEPVRHP